MYIYTIECEENGFKYQCKSLQKICEMFNLNYQSAYNSIRNLEYNYKGCFTPKTKRNIKITRVEN